MSEGRRPSRSVVFIAVAVVLLLALNGLLLLRYGFDDNSGAQSSLHTSPHASTPPSRTGEGANSNRTAIVSDVSVGPGRVVSASQQIVFDRPVRRITLAVPQQSTTVAGGMFRPRIADLRILLSHHAPLHVSQQLTPGADVTVRLPARTTRLGVAYVAHGVIRKSRPSSAHRAAALVTPIRTSPSTGVATTTRIGGTNVTNVGCFRPDGSAQSCGSKTASGWTVTLGPGERDVAVVAQVDLRG